MISANERHSSRRFLYAAALGALLCLSACSVEILHDLDEPQANAVLATFQKSGLTAQKERVASGSEATYTVIVSRSDAPRAWELLRRHNLPRRKQQGLGEIFGAKQSLVPSSAEQRALLRHALAGEITKTLQSIDGVREARVHVVLPRRDPLAAPDKKRPQPRAAVLLKTAGKASLDEKDVRKLVAGSVEGLDKQNVEVVIKAAGAKATKTKVAAAAPLTSVGPFQVAAGSRGGLLATLIASVLLILLLALALLFFALRYRALKRLRAEETSAGRATSADIESSLSLLGRSFDR